ncbi:MFS transporter [Alkalibacter rhizosphaerae]|uniref:MFS transporter n=1 Tax=Alkalibacter rhizosphaerae TaxID=2815577 RepID=A0A974XI95_9FIRM|nr:MFS transporter [Alkalibacter rhizosphaerae]QSX09185.1 MFS transporter [Alkalibacter rhizosphaerae]
MQKSLFFTITVLFWFSLYVYVPELSTYAQQLGASFTMIGIIVGSYGFTQMVLRIPLGIASDRFGQRKVFIQLGVLILGISAWTTFAAPSPMALFLTRMSAGIAASTWVVFTIYFSGFFTTGETIKSVGIINSYNALGQLLAMVLGGITSYYFGVKYLYLLAAISGVLAFLLAAFLPKEVVKRTTTRSLNLKKVLKNHQLLLASSIAVLSQLITFGTAFGFVPILAKNLGAENFQLSLLTALVIIPALLFARLSTDLFSRRIGKKRTLQVGFLISALLCIIMPWIRSLSVLYLAQFFAGVGRSMTMPLLMGLAIDEIDPENRATAMGVFQATYGIGMIIGPMLLGMIAEQYNLQWGFAVTGVFGLAAIVLAGKIKQ